MAARPPMRSARRSWRGGRDYEQTGTGNGRHQANPNGNNLKSERVYRQAPETPDPQIKRS